jgi:hypothetical protein
MTAVTTNATAIIRFMSDGSINVKLNGIAGITARKIDALGPMLFNALNVERAKQRSVVTVRAAAEREAEAKDEEAKAEARKTKETIV